MANNFNAITTGAGGIATTGDSSGAFSFSKDGGTASVNIDATGNVGIGTASPGYPLDVQSESSNGRGIRVRGRSSDGIATIQFTDSTVATEYAKINTPAASTLAFSTAGAERMRLDSSGNLLYNCTAEPSASVKGWSIRTYSNGCYIESAVGSTGTLSHYTFFNPNGQVGRIDTSASSTSYVTSSDYRLKENVAPMVGALDKVALLKPVTYKWKVDGSDGEGFIAHELAEVCPQAVSGEKDAVDEEGNPVYQGIDTSFLVATLTAAIQELKAELDTVKAQLGAK